MKKCLVYVLIISIGISVFSLQSEYESESFDSTPYYFNTILPRLFMQNNKQNIYSKVPNENNLLA